MKKIFYAFSAVLMLLSLTSCEPSLAEKLQGTWKSNVSSKGSEGEDIQFEDVVTYTMTKDNGGDFQESLNGTMVQTEDGVEIKIRFTAAIRGYWQVTQDDDGLDALYIHYNTGTLQVRTTDESLKDLAKKVIESEGYVFNSEKDLQSALEEMVNEMRPEIDKELHKSFYEDYEEHNKLSLENNYSYPYLKVWDNMHSYDTSDSGTLTYTKVK